MNSYQITKSEIERGFHDARKWIKSKFKNAENIFWTISVTPESGRIALHIHYEIDGKADFTNCML